VFLDALAGRDTCCEEECEEVVIRISKSSDVWDVSMLASQLRRRWEVSDGYEQNSTGALLFAEVSTRMSSCAPEVRMLDFQPFRRLDLSDGSWSGLAQVNGGLDIVYIDLNVRSLVGEVMYNLTRWKLGLITEIN